MGASVDKNYRLTQFNQTSISKDAYTTIFSYTGRGWLDCVVISVSDTDMHLIIEIDGINVVDEFSVKQFASIYGFSGTSDLALPISSIDSKTFKYQLRDWQQFDQNIAIKLKHATKNNKRLEAGYITFQER